MQTSNSTRAGALRHLWVGFLPVLLAILLSPAGLPAANSSQGIEFFETRIRPVLVTECYECHQEQKHKGGLRVDSRDALIKGGDSGPAIIPGNPDKSLLIRAITHQNADLQMPKKRPKLDSKIINDFVTWIKIGAPHPTNSLALISQTNAARPWADVLAERQKWWSFQPLKKPLLPAPRTASAQDHHPVDQFIFAKLEERGLSPAKPTDKRTLIRRITFALTGLPPTPQEVASFVNDDSSQAYAKLVDRLLASPRFGERWARHWMDLVRFAETHGSEGDPEIPQAWRYRDYLIRAFNADVPCDRLIREHIAGDLLPEPRWNKEEQFNESMIGIAHLRFVEHGFQPVDPRDDQVRVIENQIDVIGKAFQGLTLACARCHDHKFDPISQRDFYALAGIFGSCRPSQVTIDSPEHLRTGREELQSLKRQIKEELAKLWLSGVADVSTQLSMSISPRKSAGDEMREQISVLEQRLANLRKSATGDALREKMRRIGLPVPIAAWTFTESGLDLLGEMHAELEGGAEIKQGRLVLNGKSAFARTAALPVTIREKTLEVWVALANRDQRGGGALSIETKDGSVFDSIVFGEHHAGKWMPGSDFFRRSRSGEGVPETVQPGELVHLAIVYDTDNSIAIYRNGEPYFPRYVSAGDDNAKLQSYLKGSARVLLGMRHTGGGNPFLAGEIEEARLYDRALTSTQVKASFEDGYFSTRFEDLTIAAEHREKASGLTSELEKLQAEFKKRFPNYTREQAIQQKWHTALETATNNSHPLHVCVALRDKSGADFASEWRTLARGLEKTSPSEFTAEFDSWFRHGVNAPEIAARPGEFSVEPEGERVISAIYPAGLYSHLLSRKHNGVLTSPRFDVQTESISIRAIGGGGARVRLIVENYPLGSESIYPQAELKGNVPAWLRLDTTYRKGASAYLEFDTAEEVLSRNRPAPGAGGRSYFGVERIAFHNGKTPPKDEADPSAVLLRGAPPTSLHELAQLYGAALKDTVIAWRDGKLNEPQRSFLDFFVHNNFLANSTNASTNLGVLVAQYRKTEAALPLARRSPGVLETAASDAHLLERGDPAHPKEAVRRRYLEALGSPDYATILSGRLELAEEIASPKNPLTARVMVNRIWQQLFGRGLVATADNFGRLGEMATHPELLDYLAVRFIEHGWSIKEMIRFLATSQTYQMSSEATAHARQVDPANELVSHMPVRRLEAEAIRDSLLAISGRLDETKFGPGVNALSPPAEQRRRSIYLTIRRNSLSPFLQTFDAPKPFTTLGRREATNVPAQSLALLNDPFVIEMSGYWAKSLAARDTNERIREMFERALGRPPTEDELAAGRAYIADGSRKEGNEAAWRDFAQSIFNLKEFIYVR